MNTRRAHSRGIILHQENYTACTKIIVATRYICCGRTLRWPLNLVSVSVDVILPLCAKQFMAASSEHARLLIPVLHLLLNHIPTAALASLSHPPPPTLLIQRIIVGLHTYDARPVVEPGPSLHSTRSQITATPGTSSAYSSS